MNERLTPAAATPTSLGNGADEENLRLLTSFNDIFVSLAVVLVIVAIGWFGSRVSGALAAASVATVSWSLAEYFTRRRRMALPSILLAFCFVSSLMLMVVLPGMEHKLRQGSRSAELVLALEGVVGLVAALLHWFRFRVPIMIAVAASAGLLMAISLLLAIWPPLLRHVDALTLAAGLTAFGFAMYWDVGDPRRITYRSDVAFWLHLMAAPMIVRPLFRWIGLTGPLWNTLGPGSAPVVEPSQAIQQAALALIVYVALGMVAIAIDRRAGLVAALAYIIYAFAVLLRSTATVDASLALTALLVGSMLLLLSVFWRQARRLVLSPLPATWRNRLPAS